MKTRILALLMCLILILSGCSGNTNDSGGTQGNQPNQGNPNSSESGTKGEVTDLGDDSKTFGEDLEALGAYDGYFESASTDVEVQCVSGTDKAFKL